MIKDAFWTHDYISGVQSLLQCLKACTFENQELLHLVQKRVNFEKKLSQELAKLYQDQEVTCSPLDNQPINCESAVQHSINRLVSEMSVEAISRIKISENLDQKVSNPLKLWFDNYSLRTAKFRSELNKLISGYTKLLQNAVKCKQSYFESCRKFEDSKFEGSPKDGLMNTFKVIREKWSIDPNPIGSASGSADPSVSAASAVNSSATTAGTSGTHSAPPKIAVAGLEYTRKELADLLKRILEQLTPQPYHMSFFGTYENVVHGSMLAGSARKQLQNDSLAYATKFGQSLVDLGYLKPVGQFSNLYEVSHNSRYQLTKEFYDLVFSEFNDEECRNVPAPTSPNSRATSPSGTAPNSPALSIASNTSTSSIASDPTEEDFIRSVRELDDFRCRMEEQMSKIYSEIDNLEMQRTQMMGDMISLFTELIYTSSSPRDSLYRVKSAQQEINPRRDLEKLVSKYETGPYVPNVMVFRGYFDNSIVQTFGVDLSLSKFFVNLVLDYFEEHLNQVSSLNLWIVDQPLADVFTLRSQLNTGKMFKPELVFRFFSVEVVVSTFLHYFLELPESLIPFTIYETVKQVYQLEGEPSNDRLASLLFHTPLENREILFRLLTFLRTLLDESGFEILASALALKLMRPRAPSALSMHDTHPARFINSLLRNCPMVFSKLASLQQEMAHRKSRQVSLTRPYTSPHQPVHDTHSHPHDMNTPTKPKRHSKILTPPLLNTKVRGLNLGLPISPQFPEHETTKQKPKPNDTEPTDREKESITSPPKRIDSLKSLPITPLHEPGQIFFSPLRTPTRLKSPNTKNTKGP